MKRILQIISMFFCLSFLFCACGGAVAPAAQTSGDSKPSDAESGALPAPSTPTVSQTASSFDRPTVPTPSEDDTTTSISTTTGPAPVTDETPSPSDGTPDREDLQVNATPLPASAGISTLRSDAVPCEPLFTDDAVLEGLLVHSGFTVGLNGLPVTARFDLSLEEEEYRLRVEKERISITASGEKGLRYAVSTLAQLRCGDLIAACEIADKPAFPLRGVIEGFYGVSWTNEFRLDLFDFMGKSKLNTYVYAPKNDPKHRAAWRSLYNEKELETLSRLIEGARENGVNFVYAISPGLDIDLGEGYEKEFERLTGKCQQIYDLGVRDFAIFLDDIDARDAQGHAKLLNDFETKFVKTQGDCSPLIAISPEYETIWLTKYSAELAPLLHPEIVMMWTGRETIPDSITVNDLKKIDRIYGRKVFLWWNYPVNDMDGNALFMGPAVKLGKDLPDAACGLVANPMNQGYASLLPLLTTADYLWNPAAYDPDRSSVAACRLLAPECADGLYTFMDLTRASLINGGVSTLTLAPLLEKYAKGEEGSAEALARGLDDAVTALRELEAKGDARLLAEIGQWLDKAVALTTASSALLRFDEAKNEAEKGDAAMRYIEAYQKMNATSRKVSSDRLVPFVLAGRARVGALISGRSPSAAAVAFTDCRAYKDYTVDLIADGDDGTYFWSDGSLAAASGGKTGFVGIDFKEVIPIENVYIATGDGGRDALTKIIVEYTENGSDWLILQDDAQGPDVLIEGLDLRASAVRIRNGDPSSDKWVIVRSLEANTARKAVHAQIGVSTDLPTYENHLPSFACDGDRSTYFWSDAAPRAGSVFTLDLKKEEDLGGFTLIAGDDAYPDDYIHRGTVEYSLDGKEYKKLCDLSGRETRFEGAFRARYVRLRATAAQTNWVIIREFMPNRKIELPEGVSFDGDATVDFSPLFDRELFTSFTRDGTGLAGKTLTVHAESGATARLFFTRLSGVRIFASSDDGGRGEIALARCTVVEFSKPGELYVEFTGEDVGIAEIAVG